MSARTGPEIANPIVRWWMLRNFEFRGNLPVRTRASFGHKGRRTGGSADDGWQLIYPRGDWLEFAHPASRLYPSAPGAPDYRHRAAVDALAECPPVLGADSGIAWAETVEKWRGALPEIEVRRRCLCEDIGRILRHPVRHRRVIWYREGAPLAAMSVGALCRARLEGLEASARPVPTPQAPTTREAHIVSAMRSYTGKLSRRHGWPWLRPLRKHAGIADITVVERRQLWKRLADEARG